MKNLIIQVIKLFLILLIPFNILVAQSLNLQMSPSDKTQLGLNFDKPYYNSDFDLSTLSGVFQLHVNIPVSSKFNIIGNIPFINSSYEVDYGYGGNYSYDENGLGNIFIGMQTNPEIVDHRRSIITFGLFLPTGDEDVAFEGLFTNYYDLQKYFVNFLGLYFNYAYQKNNADGINYGIEVGPNILIPTEDNGSETEVFLHYGFDLGYQIEKILVNVEFLGLGIITQDADNFDDRLIHSLAFGGQWNAGIITPKVYYRIYLKEEIKEMIDGVLGLGINISFN